MRSSGGALKLTPLSPGDNRYATGREQIRFEPVLPAYLDVHFAVLVEGDVGVRGAHDLVQAL